MVDNFSQEVFDAYLRSREETVVRGPLADPYYGDFTGCPPICLWASASEVLRDDSLILFEKPQKGGAPAGCTCGTG